MGILLSWHRESVMWLRVSAVVLEYILCPLIFAISWFLEMVRGVRPQLRRRCIYYECMGEGAWLPHCPSEDRTLPMVLTTACGSVCLVCPVAARSCPSLCVLNGFWLWKPSWSWGSWCLNNFLQFFKLKYKVTSKACSGVKGYSELVFG